MNVRLLSRLAPLALLCSAFASQAAPVQWVAKDLGTSIDWNTVDQVGRTQSGKYDISACNGFSFNSGECSLWRPPATSLGFKEWYGRGFSANERNGTGYGGLDSPEGYTFHAFAYRDGKMTDLGTLGGAYSYGNDINNAGQAVGYAAVGGNSAAHAFLHDGQQMHDLGVLAGDSQSYATHINEAGQVAGRSQGYDAQGKWRGRVFLYSNGQMADLGSLGGEYIQVLGLHDSGLVVGNGYNNSGEIDAFLYGHEGMINLDSLVGSIGVVDTFAAYFTWDGEVVGNGRTAAGEFRWFQLTKAPAQDVPEPSALLLAGGGLLGLALTRRRRAAPRA